MTPSQRPRRDRPTGDAVTVVNLLEIDPRPRHDGFHPSGVLDRRIRICVQRLDEDPNEPSTDSLVHECLCIVEAQKARFDADPSADEVVTQLDDPLLPLVGGDEIGKFGPGGNQLEAARRIGLDGRRGCQGDWDARAACSHRQQSGCACVGSERLPAEPVERMQVDNARPRVGRSSSALRELFRAPGYGRMF
jgi:hypothetical protein